MRLKSRSRLLVFVLSFFTWSALTSIWDIQEIFAGLLVSLIVALFAGHFLITSEATKSFLFRTIHFIKYIFVFLYEMIKANINVALIVIHPDLPIKPGIVKIKTELMKDSARTVLANSITLTPGTMTVDINPIKNEYYIHWIKVASGNPNDIEENTRKISSVFEKILKEIFS